MIEVFAVMTVFPYEDGLIGYIYEFSESMTDQGTQLPEFTSDLESELKLHILAHNSIFPYFHLNVCFAGHNCPLK